MAAWSPRNLAFALLMSVAATASAQQGSTQPHVVSPSALPSAPAALTVPMPLGPPPGTIDLYFRPDNFHSNPPQPPPLFFPGPIFVPGYGYGSGPYQPAPYMPGPYGPTAYVTDSRAPAVPKGGLRFEMNPESAQVFVDGNYVGIVEDFGLRGRPLELTIGPRHVELRAPGYETVTFDLNITANQVSRYRGDLQRITAPQPPVATVSAVPKKFYIIPNCYAGTRPPTRALPQGCSLAQMREVN
jgi:PEGA domain-containing protein